VRVVHHNLTRRTANNHHTTAHTHTYKRTHRQTHIHTHTHTSENTQLHTYARAAHLAQAESDTSLTLLVRESEHTQNLKKITKKSNMRKIDHHRDSHNVMALWAVSPVSVCMCVCLRVYVFMCVCTCREICTNCRFRLDRLSAIHGALAPVVVLFRSASIFSNKISEFRMDPSSSRPTFICFILNFLFSSDH